VESVPGRLNGAWVFHDTRMPVSAVFENLEAGATVGQITDWFDIPKDQVIEVLEFGLQGSQPLRGPTLVVNLAAMRYTGDGYGFRGVIQNVDDAIVADLDARQWSL
jgi:uncharacterized protein (DUF433 family)